MPAPLDLYTVLACGFFGGVAAEFLQLIPLQRLPKESRPPWLSDWFFWMIALGKIAMGVVLVWLYSDTPMTRTLAFNIGLTAPAVPASLGKAAPAVSPGRADSDPA